MEQRTSTTTFVLDANALISAFTSFLQFDVASGGASGETIRTYWCEAKQYSAIPNSEILEAGTIALLLKFRSI